MSTLPPPLPVYASTTVDEAKSEWDFEQEMMVKLKTEWIERELQAKLLEKERGKTLERVSNFLDALVMAWLQAHPKEPLTQAVVTRLVHQAFLAAEAAEVQASQGLDDAGTALRARFRAEQLEENLGSPELQDTLKERF